MKIADITDIRVNFVPGQRFTLGFNDASARYHIWLDADGVYDWKRLYKNPPLGIEAGSLGDFRTRQLNPLTPANNKALKHVLAVVRRDGLIAKAQAAEAEREAARVEAARISVAAERRTLVEAWVKALAEVAPDLPGRLLNDDEINTIIARVRELGGDQ
jgi:acetolactate synthase regulatory subunit